MKTTIAILIFTQDVSKDASCKNLTPNKNLGLNKYVFRQLNNHVNSIAGSTKLPVFRSNDLISEEGSFGKQLTNCIQAVFEKGFEKIICLGNDCPGLDKRQVIIAAEKLQTTDTVIGPDERGGVYLLGISKDTFQADIFENIAWQSKKMLENYLENFIQEHIFWLEILADIHSFKDLQIYSSSKYFIGFLIKIIKGTASVFQNIVIKIIDNQPIRLSLLRAPPIS